jgi:LysR family transcriptional regulator, transcriptional activator of nhaA
MTQSSACLIAFPNTKTRIKYSNKGNETRCPQLPSSALFLGRRQLEHWFESHRVRPRIVAEVEDTALLTDLGVQGLGFIPVYSAVLDEILRLSRFQTIGIAKGLRMEVFAITAQRRLQHPGVVAMTARHEYASGTPLLLQ